MKILEVVFGVKNDYCVSSVNKQTIHIPDFCGLSLP